MSLLLCHTSANGANLRIGTMDLPPYGWTDSQGYKQGIIYELNEEIGRRSNMRYSNEIIPFNRMLKMLKDGELDLISSQAHKEAIDAGDKLEIQHTINVIAGTRKNSFINAISDFAGKTIAYHFGASYKQLEGIPKKIERVASYREMLKILSSQPLLDAGIFSEPAYYYWMQELGLKPSDFGDVILIEANKEQWIFVRKTLPQAQREHLKKIVAQIYNEKIFEKLLRKYGKR